MGIGALYQKANASFGRHGIVWAIVMVLLPSMSSAIAGYLASTTDWYWTHFRWLGVYFAVLLAFVLTLLLLLLVRTIFRPKWLMPAGSREALPTNQMPAAIQYVNDRTEAILVSLRTTSENIWADLNGLRRTGEERGQIITAITRLAWLSERYRQFRVAREKMTQAWSNIEEVYRRNPDPTSLYTANQVWESAFAACQKYTFPDTRLFVQERDPALAFQAVANEPAIPEEGSKQKYRRLHYRHQDAMRETQEIWTKYGREVGQLEEQIRSAGTPQRI